jgi:hypothetical protein
MRKRGKSSTSRCSRYASSETRHPLVYFSELSDHILEPFHLSLVKVLCLDNRSESASKFREAGALVLGWDAPKSV